jgi:hypothetical protein
VWKWKLRQLEASVGCGIYKGTIDHDFDICAPILELCSAGIIRHREGRDRRAMDGRHRRVDDNARLAGAFITSTVCGFIQAVPVKDGSGLLGTMRPKYSLPR